MESKPLAPKCRKVLKNSLQIEWEEFAPEGSIYYLNYGTVSDQLEPCYMGPKQFYEPMKLLPGTDYFFSIHAIHNNKKSPTSDFIKVTTLGERLGIQCTHKYFHSKKLTGDIEGTEWFCNKCSELLLRDIPEGESTCPGGFAWFATNNTKLSFSGSAFDLFPDEE